MQTTILKSEQAYLHARRKYIKAYDDLLDAERKPKINLTKPANASILIESIKFWENEKLNNFAYTVMPNHVHWVFELIKNDSVGNLVYLQDILHSVKRFSANHINKLENRTGNLWQKESFDTTIRDERHLFNAVNYTINNSVKAGLVKNWRKWHACWCDDFYASFID